MPFYFGQTLAYDEDSKSVPEVLKTFRWDEEETRKLLNFEWTSLDPFNKCVLLMQGEEVGTKFLRHDTAKIYHDGDVLVAIQDAYAVHVM